MSTVVGVSAMIGLGIVLPLVLVWCLSDKDDRYTYKLIKRTKLK